MHGLLILSTAYVTPKDTDPYWEIIAATDRDDDAPRAYLWTRDDAIAQQAIAAEGTDVRVVPDLRAPRGRWREVVGLSCR